MNTDLFTLLLINYQRLFISLFKSIHYPSIHPCYPPCHLIQLTTRWWLFECSKSYGRRSDDMITKSNISLWPKVLWYEVHLWITLSSNVVFVMAKPWLSHRFNSILYAFYFTGVTMNFSCTACIFGCPWVLQ